MDDAKYTMDKLAVKYNFIDDFKFQCPYIYQDSEQFKKAYNPILATTPYHKDQIRDNRENIAFPQSNGTFHCRNKFKTYTTGSMLNCFICAVKERIARVHNKDKETQHHLIHAFQSFDRGYQVYDKCLNSATCEVMPKVLDTVRYRFHYLFYCVKKKWWGRGSSRLKLRCQKNCGIDEKKCGFPNIWSEQKFYKKSGKYSKPKKYCKRLSNVQYAAKAADDFLNGAQFRKERMICMPSEHMNLYKENAVDLHVDTDAKALQFVLLDNENDAFLSPKGITYDVDERRVTVVYDCTRDGIAYKRCQKSLARRDCTTAISTNTVQVLDGQGKLLSTCRVWVKGISYGISCNKNGPGVATLRSNRRRRLLQSHSQGSS
jgi:hypothetical protein